MNRRKLGEIFDRSNGHCWYCGKKLEPFGAWEIEHQTPRSKGGSDESWNLVAACRDCNAKKSDRDVSEYEELLITELSNKVQIAMGFASKLNGPDIARVKALLLEASRYLYDTSLVFFGDGIHNDRETPATVAVDHVSFVQDKELSVEGEM